MEVLGIVLEAFTGADEKKTGISLVFGFCSKGSGFRVLGFGFEVLGFRVLGLGFWV